MWSNRVCAFVAVFILLALFPSGADAQRFIFQTDESLLSLRAGIGPGLTDAFAAHACLDLWTPIGLFVIRTAEVRDGLALIPENKPIERDFDVSILYGWRASVGPHGHNGAFTVLSGSLGIGRIRFVDRGEFVGCSESILGSCNFERLAEEHFGLVYDFSATSMGRAGGHISLFGNINFEQPYLGVSVGLVLGRTN